MDTFDETVLLLEQNKALSVEDEKKPNATAVDDLLVFWRGRFEKSINNPQYVLNQKKRIRKNYTKFFATVVFSSALMLVGFFIDEIFLKVLSGVLSLLSLASFFLIREDSNTTLGVHDGKKKQDVLYQLMWLYQKKPNTFSYIFGTFDNFDEAEKEILSLEWNYYFWTTLSRKLDCVLSEQNDLIPSSEDDLAVVVQKDKKFQYMGQI